MALNPFSRSAAVVASASIVTPTDNRSVQRVAAAYRPWQNTAWDFYDRLAEIHYPANFTGSSLGRFEWFIGVKTKDQPGSDPHPPKGRERTLIVKAAEEALLLLGDMSEHARRYGVNRSVAADCWLYGEQKPGNNPPEFEVLSIRELHMASDGKTLTRYPAGDGMPEQLPPSSRWTAIRMWNAHPGYSQMADGPMQPLTDDCKRLLALNDSITARLLSRLSQAGILFLPSSLTIPGEVDKPDGTNNPQDPFLTKILRSMSNAILDRNTGTIPIMVRGPDDAGGKIVYITMDREIDRVEMELRQELRGTIATGMDLPPEQQTGMSNANHWSSWSIMDSTYRTHLVPAANDFGAGLTKTYLWRMVPLLVKARYNRDLTQDEFIELRTLVSIASDGANVVARPNETKDSLDLVDRAALSPIALRRRAGVDESDAPSEVEIVRIVGLKNSDPYLATFGMKVQDQIDWDKVSTRNAGAPGAAGQGGEPPSKRPADSSDPAGAPDGGDAGKSNRGEEHAARAETLAAATVFAVRQADATVGAKLRALAARPEHADLMSSLKQVANSQVPAEMARSGAFATLGLDTQAVCDLYRAALTDLESYVTEHDGPGVAAALATFLAAQRGGTPASPFTEHDAHLTALDVLSTLTS